jgi:ABC-type multidrug transport system ATPase subunit
VPGRGNDAVRTTRAGPAIEAKGLSFTFGGHRAVEKVSFEVLRGEVIGLAGQEGAGKTTLVRMVLGLLRPMEGHVKLLGRDPCVDGPRALERVGACLSPPAFHENWTGRRNLWFAADLSGARDEARVNWSAARTGIGSRLDEPVKTYGRELTQRLAIARALVAGPELLVLDEPVRGLGPEGARGILALLRKLARDAEVGVLLASENLAHLVAATSRILVIDSGRVIHHGPASQVQAAGREVVLTTDRAERAAEDLVRVRGIGAELTSPEKLQLSAHIDVADVVKWLSDRGYRVSGVERHAQTLDEFLVRLARGPLPPPPATPPRPEDVKDPLVLLDDTETDLSAFLRRPENVKGGGAG